MAKIKSSCQHCGQQFAVSAASAGQKARCPGCQNVFVIQPLARTQHSPVTPTVTSPVEQTPRVTSQPRYLQKKKAKRKMADFKKAAANAANGKEKAVSRAAPKLMKPNEQLVRKKIHLLNQHLANKAINTGRRSFVYRFNILISAFVMLLLPVIYVSMIGVVVFGIYWHASNNIELLSSFRGRAALLGMIGYVLPILIGVMMVLFMLKPLVAAPGETMRSRKINESGEPVLFWFVGQICDIVGSPKPKQIYINHEVNAAASLENGLMGALFSRNLSLHIGVPLVAGLNVQELGGVLAHEFGHFSQGFGMRLTLIIRCISSWFARIVYEQDAWDQALDEFLDEDYPGILVLMVILTKLFLFFTKVVLWILLLVGHMVCCFLLRQMEYDADKYEIQFSGTEAFVETAKEVVLLNQVYGNLIPAIVNSAIKGKTVKSLPKSIVNKRKKLEPLVVERILSETSQEAGLFDTHPTDEQRIAKANLADAKGVFHCKEPAGLLFSNFQLTCEGITDDFYRNIFGAGKKAIRQAKKRGRR